MPRPPRGFPRSAAGRASTPSQLVTQRRLAHTRLAIDQDQTAVGGAGIRQAALEHAQLTLTADEAGGTIHTPFK
jgi:hypothetical protein